MSTIPFQQIPQNLRVPLFFAEVNNQNANTSTQVQRALLIAPMTAAGTLTANVPVISQGPNDAIAKAGAGSILQMMTAAYRLNDTFGELWYLPLADDPTGVAATGTITFTGAPTATGVLYLYVAGKLVTVTITSSMSVSQIATAVAAAVNAINTLPVTAAAALGVVTLTSKNKCLEANDIDIGVNYLGVAGGQSTPTGLTLTIAAMTGGAVNASLTTALSNLVDMPFDFIACPYTDTASLAALQAFLNDSTGRWSWQTQIYGHCFYAYRGTFSALGTFGVTRNNQHESILGFYGSPSAKWEWAAAYAGAAAVAIRANPAVPLQTIALQGLMAPALQNRFNLSERNTLLFDGISTFTVDTSGTVHLEGTITTYQLNLFGQPDNSYLQLNTMFLITFVLRALSTLITSKYARVGLAANGTVLAPGVPIVTPDDIRADLIAQYKQLEYGGYVQESDEFAAGLIVQQNANNPNRVDVMYDPTLMNQLNVLALLFQFQL